VRNRLVYWGTKLGITSIGLMLVVLMLVVLMLGYTQSQTSQSKASTRASKPATTASKPDTGEGSLPLHIRSVLVHIVIELKNGTRV
jgi:hypothetical protein